MARLIQQSVTTLTVATIVLLMMTSTLFAIELKEAQRIARLYSDQSEIISAQRRYDDAAARQTTAFIRPQLQGYARWVNLNSNDSNPLTAAPEREINAGAKATQLLFAGGRIWNSVQLQSSLEQLAQFQQIDQQRIFEYEVAVSYIDVQRQQQIQSIATDRLQQRQQELDDAQALFEVGSAPFLDVREAQLAVQQAQNDVQAVDSNLFIATTTFNRLLGRSSNDTLLTPAQEFTRQPQIDRLLQQLHQQIEDNSQLNQLLSTTNHDISKRQQQISQGEFWPNLSLVASGESYGIHRDSMNESTAIGLQLDWAILSGGETRAKTAQAQAARQRTRALKRKTDKQLIITTANIQQQHHDLLKQMERQQQSVQLAKDNYQDSRALYMEGSITLSHLGQYNLAYAESRFSLTQLLYAHNQLFHQLQRLVATATIANNQ
jgi:outer membrane protein TolC